MKIRDVAALGLMLFINRVMFADASYQETTQITGGAMVAPLKQMGFLSKSVKDMFAPITTTTMVHGNQKAVVSKESVEITDLDQQTITRVDTLHKTYSVMTFADMRKAFEDMPKQMEQVQEKAKQEKAKQEQTEQPPPQKSDLKTSFDVSVKNTGVTREVNGLTAQEQLVTMQMHVSDPNAPPADAGQTVTYVVTTDTWVAPDPPEVKEIADFDKRFAQKLMAGVDMSAWKAQMTNQTSGMAQLFSGRPGSADAMAQMGKEMAKLQGTRVMEVTTMGGSGTGMAQTSADNSAPAPAAASASSTPSMGGMLGSALGGSVLGGFHKKKAAPPADTTTPAATPAADGTQTTTTATLMEMTMQKANFSQAAVPSSAFQVPAGFKKVELPAYGGAGK